jgi:hypothetical protein
MKINQQNKGKRARENERNSEGLIMRIVRSKQAPDCQQDSARYSKNLVEKSYFSAKELALMAWALIGIGFAFGYIRAMPFAHNRLCFYVVGSP